MMVLQEEQRKKKRTYWRDWAEGLPHNIVDEILDRLVDLSDYIHFSSVCVSWRSTALDDRNHRGKLKHNQFLVQQQQQLPMLMLPHWSKNYVAQFYSLTQDKLLNFQLPVPYYTKRFIGSSCGWLISVDTNFALTLFNPFSASTISLPPVIISDIHYCFNHEYYFVKAILSADPALHPNEYVVMVIYGFRSSLAFIKPGGGGPCWHYLELSMDGFSDVIYSKSSRLFYALLRETGEVCSIDIGKEKANLFTPTLEIGRQGTDNDDLRYIVETHSGDLLQVYRFLHDDSDPQLTSYHTREIKVFKLHRTTTCSNSTIPPVSYWAELKTLGDNALFVGDCTSMCVAASDFRGCRPGSIYFSLPFHKSLLYKKKPFIWDYMDGYYDMGVANIEGKSIQPFQTGLMRKFDMFIAIANRPPIWVLPTFQKQARNGDWAALPHNILDEILDRLVSLMDYIRFADVCGSWRSAALDDLNHRGKKNQKKSQRPPKHMKKKILEDHHQLPMLMLPHWSNECRAQFYSVTHRKILDFQLPVPYYSKRFIGSSFGWLISVDVDFSITLFNPFSSSTIRLPPVITPKVMREDNNNFDFETLHLHYFNHEYYFVKAILSADPASYPHDYVVMVIYGKLRRLAFIRPGSGGAATTAHWTYLDFQMQGFSDVLYSKSSRLFYALHMTGRVYMIDEAEDNDDREIAECFPPTLEIGENCKCLRYILETRGGDLLQVVRFLEVFEGRYLTNEIKVFKLDKVTPVSYWAEVKSLGDDALFVGDSASMCVTASQFPGCRPGSIYFLLPYSIHLLVKKKPFVEVVYPCDMAVANIEGKPCEPFEIDYGLDRYKAILRRPPIWILPTFRGPY